MSKLKLFFTILPILIIITPITAQVIIHRDDPISLIIPPTFDDLLEGGIDNLDTTDYVEFAGMSFQFPILTGDPILFQNNTLKLTYTFTNPFDSEITLTTMDAEIVCTDHKFPLGHVFIDPTIFEPHQTLSINVTGILSTQALDHIILEHQGQDAINTEFKNFSVEVVGVTITMDHRKLGYIQNPTQFSIR